MHSSGIKYNMYFFLSFILLFVLILAYSLYFPDPGLLQFQPSPPGEGLISPAMEPAHITVNEEDGQVRLMVARAQGLLGRVVVGYRTTPFTASSPEDYEVNFPLKFLLLLMIEVPGNTFCFFTSVPSAGLRGHAGLSSRREVEVYYGDHCRQSCSRAGKDFSSGALQYRWRR